MDTLRQGLSDTVNELNKLLLETNGDEEEKAIRRLRRAYFALWEEVIKQEISRNTVEFKDAIESLQDAHKFINDARSDIEKVADAINKAAKAAKAVDKIVKIGIDAML